MKTLRQIMTLLVMACIVFASSTAFAASLQDEVLYEVNLERTAAGIQPLSGIVYLDQAAGRKRASCSRISARTVALSNQF